MACFFDCIKIHVTVTVRNDVRDVFLISQGSSNAGEIESICRLYEVGRQRFIDGEDSDDEQVGNHHFMVRCLG